VKFFKPLLKIAISAALIAIVLHAFDVRGVVAHFAKVDAATLVGVIAIALSISLLHTARWMAVIEAAGANMKFRTVLQVILIGHFFNQALPSSVGGDAVRIWCARRAGLGLATAAHTVIMDRMLSLFSLLLLSAAGLPWLFQIVTDPVARWALSTVLLAGAAGFCGFLAISSLPQFIADWRVTQALLELAALGRRVVFSFRHFLMTIPPSMLSFMAFSVIIFYLSNAMQLDITLLDCALLVPPVILVSVLPVSIAGWGVREGAMVVAFSYINIPADGAFAVSVLFGLTLAAASLPGSLLWWFGGYSRNRVETKPGVVKNSQQD
jgi:uncharacterized membrane protein YbhN (UPF0104 family)